MSIIAKRVLARSPAVATSLLRTMTTSPSGFKPDEITQPKARVSMDTDHGIFSAGVEVLKEWFDFRPATIVRSRKFTSRGQEILMNVSGFGKEHLTLEIEDEYLKVKGECLDFWGKKMEINEQDISICGGYVCAFDHENVTAVTKCGQLKVFFPFSLSKETKNRKGKFEVKWL